MNIRINGLIRLFNHVRSQLQTGLAPDEVEPFKQQVRKIVSDVEAICRQHGATPDHLPAPSRRAYLFLRSLDLDRLPMLTWIMFLKFLDDMEEIEASRAKLSNQRYRPAIEPPYRWRDWAAKEDGITGPELIAFVNQDHAAQA